MILVTGASGFVGRSLCRRLDSLDLPYRGASRNPNTGLFPVGAIDAATDWGVALEHVDTVIHLAARVHVMEDEAADPLQAFRQANVEGTLNLASQAAQSGAKRFVFVSSVKVHGEGSLLGAPVSEVDLPKPMDPYGQSKFEAEQALLSLGGDMQVVIVRPPLVYGPEAKANFRALIKVVRAGLPLPFASVRNKRSMVYVENLADFLIVAATHQRAANQAFLISDGHDMSTAELIAGLATAIGRKPRMFPIPPSLLELAARLAGKEALSQRLLGSFQVDISKARDLLGWLPPYSTSEGLAQTMANTGPA